MDNRVHNIGTTSGYDPLECLGYNIGCSKVHGFSLFCLQSTDLEGLGFGLELGFLAEKLQDRSRYWSDGPPLALASGQEWRVDPKSPHVVEIASVDGQKSSGTDSEYNLHARAAAGGHAADRIFTEEKKAGAED